MLRFLIRLAAVLTVAQSLAPATAFASTFGGGAVSGCSYDSASKTYSCTFLPSDSVTINNGYTVNIAGSASIDGQSVTISSGGALNIGGSLSLGNQSTINGSVSVAGSVATANHSVINGNLTAGGAVAIGNQASVTGDVSAGGDISMDNHSTVGGNLTGRDVVMYNAFAAIRGNANVYSIILNTKDHVYGTITCLGPGASGCSCVTDNSHFRPASTCSSGPPPTDTVDHILITHSGSGLTCEPQTVTLTACADAACSDTYDGAVNATLNPGGVPVTITNGSADATISQSTPATVTLSASASGAAASTCLNTANNSNSCSMSFSAANFDLQAPDQIATGAGAGLPTMTLRALQSNTNTSACAAALTGTRSVNFSCTYNNPASANPKFPASTVSVNGVSLSTCDGQTTTPVSVNFDSNGTATPTVNYPDVGQVSLNASFTTSSGSTLTGSDAFVVGPAGFQITATNSQNNAVCSTNAALVGNLCTGTADANSPVFIGAGQSFSTQVAAINANGNVTYNFGRETSPESFDFSQSMSAPAQGNFTPVTPDWGPLSGGARSASGMYADEVGILNLTATLHNASYLNSATLARPSGSLNVRRIVPDHFGVEFSAPAGLMSCATLSNKPCPGNPGNSFLYSFQPFDIKLTAYALAHGASPATITTNYQGAYAKTTSSSISATTTSAAAFGNGALAWKKSDGSLVASGSEGIAPALFNAGVANSAGIQLVGGTSYDSHPELGFSTIYPAADSTLQPPTTLYLKAQDADGVTGRALMSFVSGRLLVQNNFGAPTSYLPVRLEAQYWTGSSYASNGAYINTAGVPLNGRITIQNCTPKGGSPGACGSAPALRANTVLTFAAGAATFLVTPLSGPASAELQLALPPPAPQSPPTATINYLPSNTGRLTFGVYKSGPVVHIREVF